MANDNIKRLGRGGDTEIRDVKGEPSHVNPYEAYLIDTYKKAGEEEVERIGSGTINPATGKKEYFLGAIAAGLSIGSSIFKGFGAMGAGQDVDKAKTAAYDIWQDKLGLLGDVKDATIGRAKDLYTTGMEALGLGTQTGARDIQTGGGVAISKSNLATSGTIESKMGTQMKDLMAKYRTDAQKQMDTKQYAQAQADLSFRSGEMSAEEAYQNTLTELESQPTGFLEGMFS